MQFSIQNRFKFTMALVAVMLLILTGVHTPHAANLACYAPDPGITTLSTGYVAFGWSAEPGAVRYKVAYQRKGESMSAPREVSTNAADFTLSSGTYTFYFQTVCNDGTSDWVQINDVEL